MKINKRFYENKEVLVTGGSGMIGYQLSDILLDLGAKVTIASLDDVKAFKKAKYIKCDLRFFENCLKISRNKDIVFHLAGIKGSPMMTKFRPSSFFVPTLQFSINMMEAAFRNRVSNYLFTSSIGIYSPSRIFKEDDVWKTFPSENDRFAGWAKRICELQAQSYEIQYKWNNISIVRPANVYGPYDNFDENNAMVIPSLISKAFKAKDTLEVWGDGTQIRDFVHSRDVALAMAYVVQKKYNQPVNVGSGKGVSIKKIVEIINSNLQKPLKIKWIKQGLSGDKKRLMDMKRIYDLGFKNSINIEDGIKDTIKWYLKNKNVNKMRYNSFTEKLLK